MDYVTISTIEFEGASRVNNIFLKGSWMNVGSHWFYFRHSLYEIDRTIEEYYADFSMNPESFIKARKGDFLLLDYDSSCNTLQIAVDRLGKESGFIYCRDNNFTFSNNIWDCVCLVPSNEGNINWEAVKRYILFNFSLINQTFIQDLYRMEPASIYKFNLSEIALMDIKKYWEFQYKEDKSITIDDAVKRIDQLFDSTFKLLSQKYTNRTCFGIGLSGGWDSRILVHYAQKYKLNIIPYCVGQKYLLFPFHTYGYKVVSKIAKYFEIANFKFINYNSESYDNKLIHEIVFYPEGASNIAVGCLKSIPDFDVMLDGEHGGVFFGEFDWEPLLSIRKENLGDYLVNFLSFAKDNEQIMTEEDMNKFKKDLQSYVDKIDTDDIFEIYYKYFFEVLGSKTKKGFFESNYGTKERYSPYLNPEFIDYYLTWNSKFRMDRVLQRKFFIEKLTDLSKMPDEASDAPLYWRSNKLRDTPYRLWYAAKNHIFKSSLRRDYWLEHDKCYRNLYNHVIKINQNLIKEHFPDFNADTFFKNNVRASANLIKVIAEIDAMINTKGKEVENYLVARYTINR